MSRNLNLIRYVPVAIMVLVTAMLVGMVGHGTELFFKVEGGSLKGDWTANFFPAVKAVFFPLAFECGNALALFVLFHNDVKSGWTRFVSFVIGAGCLATSYLIQFHFYQGRTEADIWYSAVLPALVGGLSALAGLLDREVKPVETPVKEQEPSLQQTLQVFVSQITEMQASQQATLTAIQRQLDSPAIAQLDSPADWKQQALELAATGDYTQQQIADLVGKSRNTINQFLKSNAA